MLSIWQLISGYFLSYLATGVFVKLFTGKAAEGFLGLNSIEYLVYSTAFASLFCVSVVLARDWHRRASLSREELLLLMVSGLCTAYIVPSTTLIYSLPVSVMISMVLMRGSVIVVSRLVDFLLDRQGLRKKVIPWQQEAAVLFAVAAFCVKLFFANGHGQGFPAVGLVLLAFYFLAYFVRLYIMNRAKLTGLAGAKQLDQRLFFGVEQLFASGFLLLVALPLFFLLRPGYSTAGAVGRRFVDSISRPSPFWALAALSGLPYAFVAFLSVFLFLYPGKSATFTGVLNRLVSLLAGTASSLLIFAFFHGPFPPREDWLALGLISVAIAFLAWGDRAEARNGRR